MSDPEQARCAIGVRKIVGIMGRGVMGRRMRSSAALARTQRMNRAKFEARARTLDD